MHTTRISDGHARLVLAASILTCLLIAMGGIVCATESGEACPDWPGCYGRAVPPLQINAIIEYTHRLIAALTTPFILAAAFVTWRRARGIRWLMRPLLLVIPFLIAVITFGALTVLRGLTPPWAAVDLGSALIVGALVVTAAVVARVLRDNPDRRARLSLAAPLARLSLAATAAAWAVLVSAVLVAGPGSVTRCVGWPMLTFVPVDRAGWPQPARLVLAAIAALLIVLLVVRSRHDTGGQRAVRRGAGIAGLLFAAELAVGLAILAGGATAFLLVTHVVLAVALWAALVATTVLAALGPQ